MNQNSAKQIALGGVLAALAVVIMCLGGLIPGVTYVTPMFCCLLVNMIRRLCGSRIAWAWYGAVAFLALLLGPDKEAGALFLFLGYYPILKSKMDSFKLSWLWKGLLFNAAILGMYWLLINLFGMADLGAEFREMGSILLLVTLALGNLVFFLLDRLLGGKLRLRR